MAPLFPSRGLRAAVSRPPIERRPRPQQTKELQQINEERTAVIA